MPELFSPVGSGAIFLVFAFRNLILDGSILLLFETECLEDLFVQNFALEHNLIP